LAKSQSANELCSVMNHDGSGHTIFQNRRFCGPPPPEVNYCRSGGNSFTNAANHTVQMIASQPAGYNPIIIFMSDGGCGDYHQAKAIFNSLRVQFPKMQVHSVAFSPGAQIDALRVIADKEAFFHTAVTGAELSATFTSIVNSVSDSKAAQHVYKMVAEQLASAINNKLMTDCL